MNASKAFSLRACFLVLSIIATVAAMLAFSSAANAAWPAGASLVSGSTTAAVPFQSSTPATNQVVSDNGRYAFFISSSPSLIASAPNGGLFRKDLQNDSAPLDLVVAMPAPILDSAQNPPTNVQCGVSGNITVSADGRYAAFASGQNGLVAADTNGRRDVYVRDMNTTIASGSAFELASSANGSTSPATYTLANLGGTDSSLQITATQACQYGSTVPSSNSMSNDGKKVLFSNTAFTSINAVGVGDSTAPGNLFVRTVGPANATELVTKIAYTLPYNIPAITEPTLTVGNPLPDQEYFDTDSGASARTLTQASISGDGSTVSWAGAFARNQVAYQAGEGVSTSDLGSYNKINYMYRRIADGASATTRRLVSQSDLDDIDCDPNFSSYDFIADPVSPSEIACAGPVSTESTVVSDANAPILSDNGRRAFFLSDLLGRFQGGPSSGYPNDVVTVDMTPGVSRKNGFRFLTQATVGGTGGYPAPITALAASGDGKRVAFLTYRRDFSSTGLVQTGTFPSTSTNQAIFVIDGSGAGGFTAAPLEWTGRPVGATTQNVNPTPDLSLSRTGNTLVFGSSDPAFYSGANGQPQALCVKDGGTCGATPAATAPVLTVSSPIDGSSSASPVSGAYSASDATSVTCQWDAEGVQSPCPTSPLAAKTLSNGSHTFSVSATNASGTTTVVNTFTVGSKPTVSIGTPAAGATNVLPPVSPVYATSGATSVTCWWDNGTWQNPCPASPPAKALTSGAHSFSVKATNAFGSTTATNSFTALNLPTVRITKPLPTTIWTTPLAATWVATDAASTTCKWDAAAAVACTSGANKTLTVGSHTLIVTVTNAAGSASATSTFSIQAAPLPAPTVAINYPANGSTVPSPVVGLFTLGGGGANTVTCKFDTAAASACTSPMNSRSLGAGTHTLTVTATGTGSGSATSTFTVASGGTPPVVTISAPTNNSFTTAATSSVSWTSTGSPAPSCTVNGSAATSPATVSLIPGANTISVACTNASGSDTKTVTVNKGDAPVVTINSPANNSSTTTSPASVTWTTTGTAPVSCTVNGSAATSPASFALVSGSNTITVACTNSYGSDSKSVNVTYNPGTAPVVTISSPADSSNTTAATASVVFSSTGTPTPTCTVNGSPATSPASVSLVVGPNTVTVICTNSVSSDTKVITINRGVAPVVTINSPANNSTTTTSPASVTWTSTGTAPVSCTLNGSAATSPASFALASGPNTITVACTNVFGSDSKSVNVTYNPGTAPVVTISSPADNSNTTAATASVAFSSTGTPAPSCTVNGSAATSPATVSLIVGPNVVTVTCTNGSGSDTKTITINRGVAPVVTITAPADGTNTTSASASVSWTSTGTAPVACTVNGSAASSPATVSLAVGPNTVTVACTNTYGSDSKAITINRGTAPVVTITSPANNTNTASATASVSWTSTGTAPVACTVNGSAATSPATVSLAVGPNTVTVACSNAFGNDSKSITITRGTAPVVVITSPPNGAFIAGSTVNVSYTVDGAPAPPSNGACTVNGLPSSSATTNLVNLSSGSNTIQVICTNPFGAGTASINVSSGNVPVVAITSPADGDHFTTTPINVAYTVDNGTTIPGGTTCTVNGASSTTPTTNSLALVAGNNTISVTCQNAYGSSAVAAIDVSFGNTPAVNITAPTGAALTTTASSTNVAFELNGGTTIPGGTTCSVSGNPTSSATTNPVSLSIGANLITISCTNSFGTGSDSVSVTRGTAPVVTISSPANNSNTTAGSVSVAWTTTGTGPVACTVNGSAATTPSSVSLVAGPNTITVTCDSAFGSDSKSIIVNQGTAPVVTITSPANNSSTNSNTASVAWTTTGTAPVACTVNGSAATSPSLVSLNPGANTLTVACTNDFGSDTKSVAIEYVPGSGPAVTITAPADNTNTTAASTPVSWTVTGTPTPTCTLNGSTATSPATFSLNPGANTITVACTNTSGSDSKSITVNRGTPPVVTITAPVNNSTTGSSSTSVAWTSTGTAPVSCTVNGSAATSPQTVSLNPGSNTITVACTNAFGSDTKTVSVTYVAGGPPTAAIVTPASGSTIGSPVTASYTTSGATSTTCRWDSEPLLSPCPVSPLPPKGLGDGSHSFTLNAINASGTTTVSSAFTVATPSTVIKGATTIIVNFPRYCELPSGDADLAPYARFQVSNARLEAMFVGDSAHDQWGEFLPGLSAIPNNEASRTTAQCKALTIKRVVRPDTSAQTSSLKQLLNAVKPSTGWNAAYAGTTWPNPANVLTASSGGASAAADLVRSTQNSIGYADLSTARANALKKLSDVVFTPGMYRYDINNAVTGYSPTDWIYTFNKRLFWIPLEKTTTAGSFVEPTILSNGIRNNYLGSNCAGARSGDWVSDNGSLPATDYPLCTPAE